MGLRILEGVCDGDSNGRAVLYCSTTMRALPWLFESEEDAEKFLERHEDVRRLDHAEQERLFDAFYEEKRRAEADHALALEILPEHFPNVRADATRRRTFDVERATLVHERLLGQPAPDHWRRTIPIERTLDFYVRWCRCWGDEEQRREADRIVLAQVPAKGSP